MAKGDEQLEQQVLELLERLRDQLAEDDAGGSRIRGVLMAFALGLLVGGGLALLYAPRAGAATRRQLARLGGEATERAAQLADQAGALPGRAQETLGAAADRAQTLGQAARDRAQDLAATIPGVATEPSAPSAARGRAAPRGDRCPPGYPIKGNRSSSGEWIYHTPDSRSYERTVPEECFASERDAEAAGYRKALA